MPDDDGTLAELKTHEAVCAERYDAITRAIESLRTAQRLLFDKTDAMNSTLNRLAGKMVIIEAVMLALLALGVYEVLIRPVFHQ